LHSHILTVSVLRLSRKCDHPAPHYYVSNYLANDADKRFRPLRIPAPRACLSPAFDKAWAPPPPTAQPRLHCIHMPATSRSLLWFLLFLPARGRAPRVPSQDEPPTARGRLRIHRPAADGAQSLSHPPAGCRRRAVAFASAGRAVASADICPSMSVGACPLPLPRQRCPSHHWHCRRLCRLWPSASAAMMCFV
jgi:hypothetical protein